jgi:hypothetical protein
MGGLRGMWERWRGEERINFKAASVAIGTNVNGDTIAT